MWFKSLHKVKTAPSFGSQKNVAKHLILYLLENNTVMIY